MYFTLGRDIPSHVLGSIDVALSWVQKCVLVARVG
jgi:hypothetical protein